METDEHRKDPTIRPGDAVNAIDHATKAQAVTTDSMAAAEATYPSVYKGQDIQPMEGQNLLPVLDGKEIDRSDLFWEHEGNCAVRSGDWKLVRKGSMSSEDSLMWELYHLENDRSEMKNLANQHPQRVQDLSSKWQAWANRCKVTPWPWKSKP